MLHFFIAGTASNIVTYLARYANLSISIIDFTFIMDALLEDLMILLSSRGNVALSVLMTAASTLAAVVGKPELLSHPVFLINGCFKIFFNDTHLASLLTMVSACGGNFLNDDHPTLGSAEL